MSETKELTHNELLELQHSGWRFKNPFLPELPHLIFEYIGERQGGGFLFKSQTGHGVGTCKKLLCYDHEQGYGKLIFIAPKE